MKSRILRALVQADGYVSGQELCERMHVSRTAVWKVINQLKDEGYRIESVTGKGYCVLACPDLITKEAVSSRLSTAWAANDIRYYEVLDSTNNEARRAAECGAENGTLIVAELQEHGKGRRGRSWETPAGTSVAMSIVLRPQIEPSHASAVTLVMGLATAKACRVFCGVDARIKWPNDIVVDGRKIAGILTEMSSEIDYINYLVIGVGINVNTDDFPEELKEKAVSLKRLTGEKIDRAGLIAACIKEFEHYYERFTETQDVSGMLEEYNELLAGRGERVRVLEPGNEYEGISEGINQKGELLVRREDGTQTAVYAGEVSVRGVYGYV